MVANASSKLKSKNLDAVVANDVSRNDIGFDSDMNAVTIISRETPEPVELPKMSKLETAHRILDEIVRLRQPKTR